MTVVTQSSDHRLFLPFHQGPLFPYDDLINQFHDLNKLNKQACHILYSDAEKAVLLKIHTGFYGHNGQNIKVDINGS